MKLSLSSTKHKCCIFPKLTANANSSHAKTQLNSHPVRITKAKEKCAVIIDKNNNKVYVDAFRYPHEKT